MKNFNLYFSFYHSMYLGKQLHYYMSEMYLKNVLFPPLPIIIYSV